MENKIIVSKLDASKRQLETAIRLYFNNGDPVAIHTLACAAHDILTTLNKKYRGHPMIVSDIIIKKEYKKEFMQTIRKPQNFFKHADKDSEKTIDFRPEVTQYFIFDACCKYEEITGEIIPNFGIFRGWFIGHYIDIFQYSEKEKQSLLDTINMYKEDRLSYYSAMLGISVHLT